VVVAVQPLLLVVVVALQQLHLQPRSTQQLLPARELLLGLQVLLGLQLPLGLQLLLGQQLLLQHHLLHRQGHWLGEV
jgi:hypothetical protein